MSSVREAALGELRDRLEAILVANGFGTDAGALIFLGESPTLGPDDPTAAIAMEVQEDIPSFQGEHVVVTVPVDIQAIVKADADEPWMTVEAIVTDIKTAVEVDRDLAGTLIARGLMRGTVRPLDREAGSQYVGAAVQYRLLMKESWGAP